MTAMTPAPTPDHQNDGPGRIMAREMAEQPAVLRRILEEGAPGIQQVAQDIAARKPRFVLLTARGTSDNAAVYGRVDVASGELPAGTDAAALARHTGAIIQGMSQQARDGASREELEALAEIAMSIWPRT